MPAGLRALLSWSHDLNRALGVSLRSPTMGRPVSHCVRSSGRVGRRHRCALGRHQLRRCKLKRRERLARVEATPCDGTGLLHRLNHDDGGCRIGGVAGPLGYAPHEEIDQAVKPNADEGNMCLRRSLRNRCAIGRLLMGGIEHDDPASAKARRRELIQPRIDVRRNIRAIAFGGKPRCFRDAEETLPLDIAAEVQRTGGAADLC